MGQYDFVDFPGIRKIRKENLNYKIVDNHEADNKNCLIFFSGNGIYYPNTEDVFDEVIVKNDRYEWENIAKSPLVNKNCARIIFVRDVFKQWYVEGISEENNSIEKVFELLKKLTDGYAIETCGNSAGGYAAVLFGCLLKAKRIFTVSGQFFLPEPDVSRGLLLKHRNDSEYNHWYNLKNLVEHYAGEIVYIFPAKCQQDKNQYNFIKDVANICCVPVDSASHGMGLMNLNYQYLFFNDSARFEKFLIKSEKSKNIGGGYRRLSLLYKTIGFFEAAKVVLKIIGRKIKK